MTHLLLKDNKVVRASKKTQSGDADKNGGMILAFREDVSVFQHSIDTRKKMDKQME